MIPRAARTANRRIQKPLDLRPLRWDSVRRRVHNHHFTASFVHISGSSRAVELEETIVIHRLSVAILWLRQTPPVLISQPFNRPIPINQPASRRSFSPRRATGVLTPSCSATSLVVRQPVPPFSSSLRMARAKTSNISSRYFVIAPVLRLFWNPPPAVKEILAWVREAASFVSMFTNRPIDRR
jgi:hypothetical protein